MIRLTLFHWLILSLLAFIIAFLRKKSIHKFSYTYVVFVGYYVGVVFFMMMLGHNSILKNAKITAIDEYGREIHLGYQEDHRYIFKVFPDGTVYDPYGEHARREAKKKRLYNWVKVAAIALAINMFTRRKEYISVWKERINTIKSKIHEIKEDTNDS